MTEAEKERAAIVAGAVYDCATPFLMSNAKPGDALRECADVIYGLIEELDAAKLRVLTMAQAIKDHIESLDDRAAFDAGTRDLDYEVVQENLEFTEQALRDLVTEHLKEGR